MLQLNSLEPMKVVLDVPYISNTLLPLSAMFQAVSYFLLQNVTLISTTLILLLRVIFNCTVLKNNLKDHFY